MKTRKFYYLFAVCALLTLPFTSCRDDDDDGLLTPANGVSNLSFTDYDIEKGKIGGTLKWTLPEKEDFIDSYVIYLGQTVTDKTNKLGEVNKGVTSFDIPNGTEYKQYILVVAKNATGESSNVVTLLINDNETPVVTEPIFTDIDNNFLKIKGTISWKAPVYGPEPVGYIIYGSEKRDEKGEKIGEVSGDKTSFEIPEGTDFIPYIHVVIVYETGESEGFATITVIDTFGGEGLYILNGGDWNANNASLSFYDFTTGEVTTDLFKKANGSGLGDSAEQILIYGSKMYVTVTTSNRLVVVDCLTGKLIKSFEPKTGTNEPVNPRCMVAHDGKVYVSYYYAHSIVALDTTSLTLGQELPVGRYPEQLAVANGKIYVANSGGPDSPDYGNTVSVVDPTKFEIEKNIEVLINPTEIIADSKGDLYVISMGNYGDVQNTLQRIDSETDEVTVMGNGTTMAYAKDHLYVIYGQWEDPNVKFIKYDTNTEEIVSNNFATGGTYTGKSTLRVAVDPLTEKIYLSDSPYGNTATLLIFGSDGKLEKEVDTGGSGVKSMAFLVK